MIHLFAAAIFALNAGLQEPTVSDYYPLQSGDTWTYSCQTDSDISEVVYTAGAPTKLGKLLATPVTFGSVNVQTLYYRIDGDSVLLLGDDPNNPYLIPRTVLQFHALDDKWHYDYLEQGEPVNVDGKIVRHYTRSVLGKQLDVVEVHMTALVGGGKKRVVVDQDLDYAKGVGLVEMDFKQTAGSSVHKVKLELKSFRNEPIKP